MISGVNFQPGQQDNGTPQARQKGDSIQEAIKILSLRLPKKVGPNAIAPAALLNSQGSGGNPRIDSIVNTVMGRMFPQGQPPSAPMVPSPGPSFSGSGISPNTPLSSLMQPQAGAARSPRISPIGEGAPGITFDNPGQGGPGPVGSVYHEGGPGPVAPPPPGFEAFLPPQSPAGVPGTVPDTPPPTQLFDSNPPARPSEGSAAPAPTQNPWADLMDYLRRKGDSPMSGQTPGL